MKIRNTITKLITLAIAIAAMAVIGSSWATGRTAAQTNIPQQTLATPPVGFVPGEMLRFCVVNPNTPEQGGEPVSTTTYVYDSIGRVVSQTVPTTILPGQFISFDFKREDLRVAGEPGTDRLEVRADVQVGLLDGSRHLPRQILISRETVDTRSGSTSDGGNYFTGTVTVSGEGFN